jgi:hypothetical protein
MVSYTPTTRTNLQTDLYAMSSKEKKGRDIYVIQNRKMQSCGLYATKVQIILEYCVSLEGNVEVVPLHCTDHWSN